MILLTVKDGYPIIEKASLAMYNKTIEAFNNTGKKLVLIIEEYSPGVTEKQEGLFKALMMEGMRVSGYTYSDFENELLNNFSPFRYETSILGDKIKIRKKVSEMTNKEFNLFLEQSIAFCSEFFGFNFE